MFLKTLRVDQSEAFEKAKPLGGFALLSEQRVGKTPVSVALIDHWKPARVLVITTVNGIPVWKKEFRESLVVDWPCIIRIINYAQLRKAKRRREIYRWLEAADSITISDEAHNIKRRGSKQSKFVRGCGKRSVYKLALTGTMIANGLEDAWAIFNFFRPSAFGSFETFARRHLRLGGFRGKKVVGYKNKERFARILERYSYRITLREARARSGKTGLVSVSSKQFVSFEDRSNEIYNQLEEEMFAIVDDEDVTTDLAITQSMKMQQLAGGFIITDAGNVRRVGSEKLNHLAKLFTTNRKLRDGKVVIVARFLHEIRAIDQLMRKLGRTTQIISGGSPWTGHFHADTAILQIQSGAAIDLASANSIIFFSWDYSYINLAQTRFRVLSFDTDRVNYYFILVRGSIDEQLYQAVTSKMDFATLILDHYRNRRRRCPTKRSPSRNPPRS
jgi:hypothetical protein